MSVFIGFLLSLHRSKCRFVFGTGSERDSFEKCPFENWNCYTLDIRGPRELRVDK